MSSSFARTSGIQPHGERPGRDSESRRRSPPIVSPRNGRRARRHLVQHHSKREQIGARIQFLAPHLLRRHVGHCAELPRRGSSAVQFRTVAVALAEHRLPSPHRVQLWPSPKSRILAWPRFGHENVRRLDVTVDDPFGVRRIERVGDLDSRGRAASPSPAVVRRCDASASRRPETPWR